ncbi:exonuclease VII, large subunit [Methylophaga aminisulfidivorans MP]|uniref:Exodeoxyribonuclease 7 large subunit n=1 Tax=Methylophaga aminisulfidivorans MP TaxID=1026882 RepID=F5T2M6_9GAMM|nr:exodeoxyribonuclease VII large subunit [Methylophaga aminisulfidivorans]EGL53665.1 exonuclease VII, large subunit [Methylophaga aminisulfidivorans MP]
MAVQSTSNQTSALANRAVKDVYPVSRLVREARVLLEGSFPLIWVEGEISNLAMPASGHIYFTLKDEAAQVRCAMFRNRNNQLRFTPENGMQVLLRVRVSLYEGRGEFQLIIEHMEEAGSGALQRAYEALKHRLGQEGLFDQAHKKTLPILPKSIGIISSPDGAAVHDIVSVLKRRFPAVDVVLYPVAVQGENAAGQLVAAVKLADQRRDCDVIIIGRGGGSLEDLWSFNDEQLARAIFACELPIISAVGHEIDFTICDFVADVRAPTPSAAAELAVPDAQQYVLSFQRYQQQLTHIIRQRLITDQRHLQHLHRALPRPELILRQQTQWLTQQKRMLDSAWRRYLLNYQQKLDYLSVRLKHPKAQIDKQRSALNSLSHRLQTAFRTQQKSVYQQFQSLQFRLQRQVPLPQIDEQQKLVQTLAKQNQRLILQQLQQAKQFLAQQMRTLAAVSPLNTLDRGYSITSKRDSGEVITTAAAVSPGDEVLIRLHKGLLSCEVKKVDEK